jgi:hypothetical protein
MESLDPRTEQALSDGGPERTEIARMRRHDVNWRKILTDICELCKFPRIRSNGRVLHDKRLVSFKRT